MKWIENIKRKRNTKKFIKGFIANPTNSVILKQWEYRGWGNSINVGSNGLYGHLSNVRSHLDIDYWCDLRDKDIVVFESSDRTQSENKKYDIGLFCNVKVCNDPPDMFFAQYLRLGFADDFSRETIIELAKQRIKKL